MCSLLIFQVSLDREIDFAINLHLGTKPIFTPRCHMAPAELKELNDQLWDLFSKIIIQSSVPPQSAPIFCEEERWIHDHV